jgi:prefoldin alpha subunit
MEINEEDLSKRLLEIEYIRKELENYINALNALQMTQDTLSRSLLGLGNLKSTDKEVLLPYSPDIFLRGTISDANSAVVNIGSNIFKTMHISDLRAKLEKDLGEVQTNIEQIARIIQQLQEQGSKLEQEANKMYEDYQTSLK